MTFRLSIRPAAVLGLTLATVLAAGCQSMNRPATTGSSDMSTGAMGNIGSTTISRRSSMDRPANPATSTDQTYLGGD
jgi:hypothetical protein